MPDIVEKDKKLKTDASKETLEESGQTFDKETDEDDIKTDLSLKHYEVSCFFIIFA